MLRPVGERRRGGWDGGRRTRTRRERAQRSPRPATTWRAADDAASVSSSSLRPPPRPTIIRLPLPSTWPWASEVTTLCRYANTFIIVIICLTLGNIWSRGMTKIRSIAKYYRTSWNDLPPHQQSSHEAELHWSVESTRSTSGKESCPLEFHLNFGNLLTKTTEKRDSTGRGWGFHPQIWHLHSRLSSPYLCCTLTTY